MSEEKVLKRLAEIRSNVEELRKYHSDEWIMREVLASMALSREAAQHLRALDEDECAVCHFEYQPHWESCPNCGTVRPHQ